jgi:hypothetical protein
VVERVPKFWVDLADFTVESERLGVQLALFLVEKAGLEAEASGSRVVFKCEPNTNQGFLQT